MRRILTWLLIGAVVALGAAASIDGLRGGGEPERESAERERERERRGATAAAESPASPLEGAAEELRAAGVQGGVLTFADEDCTLHAVSLPGLEPHPVSQSRSCRFTVAAGVVSFGRARPDPRLFLTARCRRGSVELRTSDDYLLARYPGCAPTWRRDGLLTVIRDGNVVELSGPLAERSFVHERIVLSGAQVERQLRRAGWVGYRFATREIAWLPGLRIAAIVRARSRGENFDLLAVFSGGRLVSAPGFGYERLEGLRPSPRGRYVAAHIGEPGGLALVDRDGRPVRLALPYGRAVTWSPDEEWVAEAMDEGIVIFRADERTPRPIFVPIPARDLVWR